MKRLSFTHLAIAIVSLLFIAFLLSTTVQAAGQLDIRGPAGSGVFGLGVTVLPNGNVVVTDPDYDILAPISITDVGAVYLYDGRTGLLLSKLTGSRSNDRIGNAGIIVLPNGNFLVSSTAWASTGAPNAGAMTWCSGTAGLSGSVGPMNSLVGSTSGDQVGLYGAAILTNGNYVVISPNWNSQRGAVTFGAGGTGVSGAITSGNSLVGTNAGERVGTGSNGGNGVFPLPSDNYGVISSSWNSNRGAVTWASGTTGLTGTISNSNSLVGTASSDNVGIGGVIILTNGNFVVNSFRWNDGAVLHVGAITLVNGMMGTFGDVSRSNSLIGTLQNEQLGVITPLTNGNYVVRGPRTVTFGSGVNGVTGNASAANSLVGTVGDDLSLCFVTPLKNGNYVVSSQLWDNNGIANAGAVTFCGGTVGCIATISSSNSLVGTGVNHLVGGGVIPLPNGNYVVSSRLWNSARGAATWGSGTSGVTGDVSASNSLIGSDNGDQIGAVTVLANDNYVVSSSNWNGLRGSVTLCNGSTGLTGTVTASNSLVGTNSLDRVGPDGGVIALPNGNFVVGSPEWNGNRGAATFVNGVTGLIASVSSANSLVGGNANDRVGNGFAVLTNNNFVVRSPNWTGSFGAITWGSASTGVTGTVSASNSLVGSNLSDGLNDVIVLPNGNYVVRCPFCNNSLGAVIWGNGTTGVTGTISAANSLVGSTMGDTIGNFGVTTYSNSNYVVRSSIWDNGTIVDAGAVTLGNGSSPLSGPITASNSVRGTADNGGAGFATSYNAQTGLLAVGRPASNIVTLFGEGNFRVPFDFDGDRRSDISVFRPTSGYWYILNSTDNSFRADAFGTNGDQIVPGDYDGDGKADTAVWRPSTGYWYMLESSTNAFNAVNFGQAGDIPSAADYDGDGMTDVAVYRPSNFHFYVLYSSDNSFHFQQWGQAADIPVAGDYDGDDRSDFAIFRPSTGTFFVLLSSNGQVKAQQFGQSGDSPIAGDFDGDSKTDIAVYRPASGFWYVSQSSDDGFRGQQWGTGGDVPTSGDYDGDGKWDLAVFRPSSGTFYILQSTNGSLRAEQFGTNGDVPVASAFVH